MSNLSFHKTLIIIRSECLKKKLEKNLPHLNCLFCYLFDLAHIYVHVNIVL